MKISKSGDRSAAVSSLARAPLFVSSRDKLDDAFRIMREQRAHYALVKNETEEIKGLITLEDIIEELIGEIYDESDKRKKGIIT